jgi:hypothetical protein
MARLMNALQLALGSVGSGIQGYGQARAAREEFERQQKLDTAAAARASMMDQIMLGKEGFTEAGVRQERTKAATPAIGAMMSQALSMGRGAVPSGVLPDMSALDKTAGMYGKPVQSFEVGGKTYENTMTFAQRNLMEAEAKKNMELSLIAKDKQEQRRIKEQDENELASAYSAAFTGKDGKPMPMAQALAAAKSGKTPLDLGFAQKPMTEEEQQRLSIMRGNLDVSRGQLGVARDRLALDKTKEGATKPAERFTGDYTQTLEKIADFLPTLDPKTGALVAPKRPLSAQKSFLVQEGSPERGFTGRLGLIGSSTLGYDTSEEQLYNTLAKEVATAYAMKEQQGRNVSNTDLLNRQSQITVQPNEIGNLEIEKVKGDRLRQWAQTLQSGAPIPQVKAGETIVPPTLGETRESLRDAGFSEPEINAYFAKKGGGK